MSSYELDEYRPGDRDEYVAMLGQAWGVQGLTGEEFDWWFERNPAGSLRSVARMDGKVVGASAHTLHRMVIGGEERLMGFACHAVTDPVARGLGIFTALQRHLEERAQALGSSVVLGFANPVTNRMFFGVLGWSDLAHYRIWARPARGRGETPPPAGLEVEGDAAAGWVNHVVRDTAHLAWRFLGTPRGYVPLRSPGGYAVVWPDKPYGSRAIGVVSDLAAPAKEIPGLLRRAAKVSRGRMLFALPAPEQHGAFLKAGFVPTHKTVHLIGRALNDELDHDPGAWRFTLGDADYY